MRILIYGAGVIGSLYAALFHGAGEDVTVYARGRRLDTLREKGIQYRVGAAVKTARVKAIGSLPDGDRYDFIFLTVREEQLRTALQELASNQSPYIVTMVNSAEEYAHWEEICGAGRIISAFPGAGGGFEGEVLHASLTPRLVQPTTFGILRPAQREAAEALKALFRRARIPYSQVRDMHAWQICHLGLVVPLGDAYSMAKNPARAGLERDVMERTAAALRNNFRGLVRAGVDISPRKLHILRFLPLPAMSCILRLTFESRFGDKFMYRHAVKAPGEMQALHDTFYTLYPSLLCASERGG